MSAAWLAGPGRPLRRSSHRRPAPPKVGDQKNIFFDFTLNFDPVIGFGVHFGIAKFPFNRHRVFGSPPPKKNAHLKL